MKILGIETSTEVCSVGLVSDDGVLAERSIVESHIHSEKIVTLTHEVLRAADIALRQVTAVAVSIGPGSFSGLRIGLSTAKGLCYAQDIPLVVVPTFSAVASAAFEEHPEWNSIVIALDARQGEFYAGRFLKSSDRASQEPTRVATRQELVNMLSPDDIVLTDSAEGIQDDVGKRRRMFSAREFTGGANVAAVGRELFREGQTADPGQAEPMYLKNFVVKTAEKG